MAIHDALIMCAPTARLVSVAGAKRAQIFLSLSEWWRDEARRLKGH